LVICAVFWATVFRISSSLAQTAAPITSSGLNTQVTISATSPTGTVQHDITGGTRVGTNLFHSFGNFNVPNNNIANFLNDTGLATDNILGRVTGGNASSIFGTIQTTGFGSANLFLMNPSGIVFGPTASLNVGGSVTFTTADYLRLNDNKLFHAIPNVSADALLSTRPVAAYGFLGSNHGAITIQGSQLTMPQERVISLVGGNITIQNGTLSNGTVQPAHLLAPNGQINLATTQSPGEFLQDLTAAPNINSTSFRSYGSAHFTSGSTIDFNQTGNGKISIRGGQLILEIQNSVLDTARTVSLSAVVPNQDNILLAPGSSIVSRTFSADRGPDIQLVADHLQIIGNADPLSQIETGIPVNILARTNGSGDAGNIALRTTGNLELINLVRIESTSGLTPDGTAPSGTAPSPILAPGNAGNVDLTSTHGNIRMTGFATWATSQTGNSSGITGTVTASAPEGEILLDGANLFTSASSQSRGGGQVTVTAQNLRMVNFGLISADNESLFKTGGITVTLSDNLEVVGSVIAADSVSAAPAGDITLTGKDIVVTRGSIIINAAFASGSGGHLKIVADTLQVTDGAQLSSGSTFAPDRGRLLDLVKGTKLTGEGGDITIQALGPRGSVLIDGKGSGIFADTEGTGAGGAINLFAKTLTIQNGGTISASTTGTDTRATGGSIIVKAMDHITLTDGGSITASSVVDPKNSANTGIADAGNIKINAGQQLDVQNSSITTKAEKASGGNIDIRAIDHVRFANSQVSTSVGADRGNGGNITVDPNVVVLQNSQVLAQAVQGHGGSITITTPVFLPDQTSRIDASSQFGVNGTVTVQSPTSNLSGTVKQLTTKPSEVQTLLQNRCVALAGGEQSTFIVAGRDALPSEPGGWLSSPLSMNHFLRNDAEQAAGPTAKSVGRSGSPAMVIPMQETQALSLRRLTPPGFLVRTFGIDGLTSCRS
jgi:filamentous hemagglutinin family protein